MSKLVQTKTIDNLLLQGYYSAKDKEAVILHIHGFEGNFYENYFVHVLADHLDQVDCSFLSANTRGCEKIKDFNTPSGEVVTIGARFELLEDSPKDIDAWIEFLLNEGFKKVILQGHSLGTMKAVRYMHEGKYKDKIEKLILLAPFDKKALMNAFTDTPINELIQKAQLEIEAGNGDQIITSEFDSIKVSYKTYVSWYKQDDLGRMFEFSSPEYDFPALKALQIPVKVIVGSLDEFFYVKEPNNYQKALDLLKSHIPNCETILVKGANYGYTGFEDILATEVTKFL